MRYNNRVVVSGENVDRTGNGVPDDEILHPLRPPLLLLVLMVQLNLVGCQTLFPGQAEIEPIDYCSLSLDSFVSPIPAQDLVYELYVRSYYDTDGDGIGDLQGVIEKLDYLQELGVGTVWLMPPFESPSPTGYDPTDLDAINSDFGTQDDLTALTEAAADRNMRILADAPINHTSRIHPWFLEAEIDDSSDLRDRYLFSDHQWDDLRWFPADGGGYYYAYFGSEMPDLDWTQPDVANELLDSLQRWVDLGLGGYRVDAIAQLIEEDDSVGNTDASHCMMAWLYGELKGQDPDTLLLGEAWVMTPGLFLPYLGSEDAPEIDWLLDIPRHQYMESSLKEGTVSIGLLRTLRAQRQAGALDRLAPYMNNHDVARLPNRIPDERARRAWMVQHLLQTGAPVLYYGDELDLENATNSGEDFAQRAPMPWSADANAGFTTGTPWFAPAESYLQGRNVEEQDQNPASMLSLTRQLVALRQQSAALQEHSLEFLATRNAAVLAFRRSSDEDTVTVVQNFSAWDQTGIGVEGLDGLVELTDQGKAWPGGRDSELDLAPYAYRIFASPSLADHLILEQLVDPTGR